MFVRCVSCLGSGLGYELITRSEEAYRVYVCERERERERESSSARRPRPDLGCSDTKNQERILTLASIPELHNIVG